MTSLRRTTFACSAGFHLLAGFVIVSLAPPSTPPTTDTAQSVAAPPQEIRHIVFIARDPSPAGGGGGGGGNRQAGPIRHAEAVGSDAITRIFESFARLIQVDWDEQAIVAAAQWRFEPGRLAGRPVDVLVTVMIDFWIR